MHYEEMRSGFRQTRFEHINYFKLGDGFLTNYLNAQYALALAAREEGQLTYAREVVTRLLYLLSTLDQKAETNYLKGQILSQIIIISNEIGDLYTARKFYDLADEFIIKNILYFGIRQFVLSLFKAEVKRNLSTRSTLSINLLLSSCFK